MSSYWLLEIMISDEKWVINLIIEPLYMRSHFLLLILSLSLSFYGLIIMCLDMDLYAFIPLGVP